MRGTFGFSGFGTAVLNQSGGVEYLRHGGGFAFFGGVEIGRVVGLELRYAASFHNPAKGCSGPIAYSFCDASYMLVQTISADLKLHIPTDIRFVPYFLVGPAVGWIGRSDHSGDASGVGFEIGGGGDYWFSRHGTIGFEMLYRGLRMSDYESYTGTDTFLSLIQVGGTIAAHF